MMMNSVLKIIYVNQDVVLESGKAQDSSSATFPPVDHPSDLTDEAAAPADSPSSLNEEKTQSVKSLSKSNTNSPGGDFIGSMWITLFNYYYKIFPSKKRDL